MKKYFFFFLLTVIILSGCSIKEEQNRDNNTLTTLINEEEDKDDFFDKKIECSKLSNEIKIEIEKETKEKKRNVVLDKIFYSPQYNSCLYGYVVEDDTSLAQCKLEGEMSHNDTFVIKDHLTGAIVLYQTKGCNNFWGDNFHKKIEDLEKSPEGINTGQTTQETKNVQLTEAQRLNEQCKTFGKDFLTKNKSFYERPSKGFFYSKRLDTCVMTNVDELGIEFGIYDIKRNYLKPDFQDPRIADSLFYCDKDGVDNVILKKAEKHGGKTFQLPYEEYLDNAEGGLPRTLKTPENPYTRDHCKKLFNKKLVEIK